jgi:hypothetical protein
VISNVQTIVESVNEHDHVTVSIGKDKSGREKVQAGANLAAVIKDMEREMREAATNLEFEKAAKLRDEVKRLREMELDVAEGTKDLRDYTLLSPVKLIVARCCSLTFKFRLVSQRPPHSISSHRYAVCVSGRSRFADCR